MKIHKPTSAGKRNLTTINYREVLSGSKPEKSLLTGIKKRGLKKKVVAAIWWSLKRRSLHEVLKRGLKKEVVKKEVVAVKGGLIFIP